MTPTTVIEFLKSNRLLMPDLPTALTKTPFKDIKTLRGIMAYCFSKPDLIFDLDDLPFGEQIDPYIY